MRLDPDSVFEAFWATALEDAQFNENENALEDGREPRDIEGEPAAEYEARYRDAVRKVCEAAEPLLTTQDPNTFPERCPGGDIDGTFGSDLYLTAVGHGAGFWDGDWNPIGDELTEITKRHMPDGSLAEHIDGGWFFL